MNIKLLTALMALILIMFISVPKASAETMSNSFYKLQMGNLNSISGESTNSQYGLNITSGELAPGEYSGTNYTIKAGFQYVSTVSSSSSKFNFSVSSALLDFGILSPTNPVTRTNSLTINNNSSPSYQLSSSENHPLQASTGFIPDTSCDNGQCNEAALAGWSSTLTYGFGFRCDNVSALTGGIVNKDCASSNEFSSTSNGFMQFADTSKSEAGKTIVSGGSGLNQKATLTYKVNISSSQPPGTYSNAVTFILTPSL